MINSSELIDKVKSYNKFLNPKTLTKAYDFAVKAHEKQKRHICEIKVYSAIHCRSICNLLSLKTRQQCFEFRSIDPVHK